MDTKYSGFNMTIRAINRITNNVLSKYFLKVRYPANITRAKLKELMIMADHRDEMPNKDISAINMGKRGGQDTYGIWSYI